MAPRTARSPTVSPGARAAQTSWSEWLTTWAPAVTTSSGSAGRPIHWLTGSARNRNSWRAGRRDDARRWLEEAAAADPGDAKALAWVGTIAREQRRTADALAAFRRALARDPLLVAALIGGALTAVDAGARDDAARWLQRARRLAPGDARLVELERRVTAGDRA